MITTIGEIVSRVKRPLKANVLDAFVTDRYVYSLLMKHGRMMIRRQDAGNKVMSFEPIFQPLEIVQLIDVDKVQAHCIGLSSDCEIKRTERRLPEILEGYNGPLIREITSLDGSERFEKTTPTNYLSLTRQKNFKYNKKRYFWFLDGHLFFPNLDWEVVSLVAAFENDVTKYSCNCTDYCVPKQDQRFFIPEYMHSDLEKLVKQDFATELQIPSDNKDDNQNILK